jgi:hypothetical protein
MQRSRNHDLVHMRTSADRIEYVVRQRNDIWLIEHDGGQYGPYKDRHEAMFFAIDAAHKLGELGKSTRVRPAIRSPPGPTAPIPIRPCSDGASRTLRALRH